VTTYRDYYPTLFPAWLRGENGEAWATAWGVLLDGLADSTTNAVKCRVPREAPADALAYIGSERNLNRVPLETNDQYRARLEDAWEAWSYAGTDRAIVDQLELLGLTAVCVRNNQWVWDSNSGNVANYWARFWVVLSGHGWGADDTWGADTWGDGGLWGLDSTVSADDVAYARDVVRKWKSAHAQCVNLIAILDGGLWGYPIDDTWGSGTWGGEAAYVAV